MAQRPGCIGPYINAGAPTSGTDAICTLTFTSVTGGTFKLTVTTGDGVEEETAAITWSATNNTLISNIDAALEALSIATGTADFTTADATLSSGLGTLTITAAGAFLKEPIKITVSDDATKGTGAAVTAEMTTPGVWATLRGARKGALLTDVTNGILYINTGTANKPTWTKVGTQS